MSSCRQLLPVPYFDSKSRGMVNSHTLFIFISGIITSTDVAQKTFPQHHLRCKHLITDQYEAIMVKTTLKPPSCNDRRRNHPATLLYTDATTYFTPEVGLHECSPTML